MIFARDKSQMCNNLLQYAHVYAWGRAHGRKVISMRFSYKYQFFHICHTSLTGFGWYLLAKYAAALKILPTANFKSQDCDLAALERKMLSHRHIVVSGWNVRFYDHFLNYRDEICQLFQIDSQYTEPVRSRMKAEEAGCEGVKLGVHIRRGDYAQWQYGKYCFDDDAYARHINRFAEMVNYKLSNCTLNHEDRSRDSLGKSDHEPVPVIHVYLSTNDPEVSVETFQRLCPKVRIHLLQGSAPSDLYMLSACDYVMGPPSTFSLVAAMYRDLPLYRMDSPDETLMTPEAFRKFDYWFRHII